ncbi:MAG: acyl carrier protein [Agathobacter sp.]|nr:acyl carrier protein [Agathobacter sp.]
MELKDYDNALKECEAYKRVSGQEEVYARYVKWIQNLKSGKRFNGTAVEEKLKKIVSEILNVNVQYMNSDTRLSDLGADSLDAFQIVMGVEEEFDIEVPSADAEMMTNCTLGQIATFIAQMR